jgi:hypothetical protein
MLQIFKALSIVAFCILITLLLTGQKRFTVWKQITDEYHEQLLSTDKVYLCRTYVEQNFYQKDFYHSPAEINAFTADLNKCSEEYVAPILTPDANPKLAEISHFIRLNLMKPVALSAAYFKLSMHTVFSVVCIIFLIIISYLHSKLVKFNASFLLSLGAFSITFIPMNGRMIIGFLCFTFYLLICDLIERSKQEKLHINENLLIFYSGLLLLLSHISTGVNFIVFVLFFILLLNLYKENFKIKTRVFLALFFIVQLFLSSVGVLKNYLYFDQQSSAPTLQLYLNHGISSLFSVNTWLLVFLTILILISVFYIFTKNLHAKLYNQKYLGFFMILLGGTFGLSVLASSIPFLIHFVLIFIYNRIHLPRKEFTDV